MSRATKRDEQAISATLAAATCALLGTSAPAAVQADEGEGWDFNTSVLYYGEDENRVQDISISAIGLRTFVDDRILSLGITVDGLTGATPSGAIRQDVPQTFTRPSGSDAYDVAAGELPLDDTFKDTRVALTANWQQPFGETSQLNFGGSLSKEYDYLHLGVNTKLAKDFNKRNTTVSAGLAFAHDELDPVGGAPIGFTAMLDEDDTSNRTGKQDKDVIDFVIGVSQVVARNMVVQANYSYSYSDGYLTDPYKILSVVDPVTGDTIARTVPPGLEGPSHVYLFENRPDERTKHSFYFQTKYFMDGKVLDASYRYMTDDWDIDSHTVDLRYRWPLGDSSYLEPHARFYTQTEAEFYQVSLVNGVTLPAHASADFRLGNFDAITAGLKYGWKTRNDHDMSLRLEWYTQSGSIPAGQLIGNQVGRDNYPDLNAIIVQFGYRF